MLPDTLKLEILLNDKLIIAFHYFLEVGELVFASPHMLLISCCRLEPNFQFKHVPSQFKLTSFYFSLLLFTL